MKKSFMLESLHESLHPLREEVVGHEVYNHIKTLKDLQIFMEHHVFAVWDFMSLLKALQGYLTCVTVPWLPQGNQMNRRFINEIVLAEESDERLGGGYMSHFELYKDAMNQCGANTSSIDEFLNYIQCGQSVFKALDNTKLPNASRIFVETTWKIIESGSVPSIAGAFTLGREGLIPDMFKSIVNNIPNQLSGQLTFFQDYLERHIDLDEKSHTPMALQTLMLVCNNEEVKWREVEEAARTSLKARISLWNSVVKEIAIANTNSVSRMS